MVDNVALVITFSEKRRENNQGVPLCSYDSLLMEISHLQSFEENHM